MRSSSWGQLAAVVLCVLSALVIAKERPGLAERYHDVKTRSDAYLLPSVDQTYVASLGYRSALADLIFGHLLVSYGLHFQERRLFQYVGDYLDVINRLDPKFRDPYRIADTLLTLQPVAPPLSHYRKAREIQERGLQQFPYDQELWSTAGQYIAYLAPAQLTDEKEREEYQHTGARYLMRACELIGSNERLPYHCITAAQVLNREGNLEALRQFLERVQGSSDDPQLQKLASSYLARVAGEQAQSAGAARQQPFRDKWHRELLASGRTEADAVGPGFDAAACAGARHAQRLECASSWRAWARLFDGEGPP